MHPGGPSIGVFNASFALIVRTVRTYVRYRKPWLFVVWMSGPLLPSLVTMVICNLDEWTPPA